jgi:hypothetical protein
MKQSLFILFVVLFLCSCVEINFKNDLASENEIQLNSIQKVIITKDDGLLVAGVYDSKITFIKTDADFRTLWRKDNYDWGTNIYGSWGQSFYGVQIVNIFQNDFKNFICIASVQQGGDVIFSSVLIFELSQEGEQLRKMEIKDFSVYNAFKTTDGGYILSGSNILKLDKDLKVNWEKNYYRAQNLWPGKIINTNDGRYALTSWNGDKSYFKVLDNDGNELESKEYSFNDIPFNETGNDLIQLNDKGFIIVGRTRNRYQPWYMDCGVIRINSSGNKIWTKIFGSSLDDWLEDIIYASENEFIFQGRIGFPNNPVQKTILFKMNLDGQIGDSCTVERIERLLYNPKEYFIKTIRLDDNYFRVSKIPLSEVFNINRYN